MINLENKCITIEKEVYEIIEHVTYNDRMFAYLVNRNSEIDSMFKELVPNGKSFDCLDIEPELFKSVIINLFVQKFENY